MNIEYFCSGIGYVLMHYEFIFGNCLAITNFGNHSFSQESVDISCETKFCLN